MIRVLTGIGGRDFRHEYGFRVVDDLLRYTSMTVGEIAQHTGFHSASSLCQQYIKYRHITPDARRKAIRQERDEGRYRL
jgi:transcriptional regulator GlxA family with amidase domain